VLLALSIASGAHAAGMTTPAAQASSTVQIPWLELFGGAGAAPESDYGYVGMTGAFNHDLQREGWVFRVVGGGGTYSYNRVTGLRQSANYQTGDLAVGYQIFLNGIRISGFLGANVEHHANDDPFALVKGTRGGVKGQAEVFAPVDGFGYVYALGTFSSVWNNYLALGKLGYRLTDRISAGPELLAIGNVRYDAVHTGPFVSFSITPSTDIIVSVGYSWDRRRDSLNDNSGAYGSIHLRSML
jgi:hypothetical protein